VSVGILFPLPSYHTRHVKINRSIYLLDIYLQNLCAQASTCHHSPVSRRLGSRHLVDSSDKIDELSLFGKKGMIIQSRKKSKKMKKQRVHLPPQNKPFPQNPKWLGNSSLANLPRRPPATPYNAFTKSNDPTLSRRYPQG